MDIQLDFISSDSLRNKTSPEKIEFILDRIRNKIIVVLEVGLTPQEETGRIEATTGAPIVMLGTKCPSMTSTWI